MRDFLNKTWAKWTVAIGSLIALFAILFVIVGSTQGWNNSVEIIFRRILIENFLAVNPLLLGLITLVGYLILGRTPVEATLGFMRTAIGVIMLSIGAGTLVGMLKPVFAQVGNMFPSSKIIPLDPYLGWTSGNEFLNNFNTGAQFVSWISYAFIVGFAINIVLVALKRWTNIDSIVVTGHIMLQQATIVTVTFWVLLFGTTDVSVSNQVGIILISGLFLGTYWGFASTATYKGTQKVTNNAGFSIGHQQMLGAAIAYKVGRFFGKAEDSSETRKMPKRLKILEDNLFTQLMILLVLLVTLIIIIQTTNSSAVSKFAENGKVTGDFAQWKVYGNAHWVLNMLLGVLKVVASIFVLTSGVRMFVSELQQSFQGISTKLIPGATVGVDVAAVYGFSPNSATFGFLSGTLGQFLGVALAFAISAIPGVSISIAIPLFITLFFNSGAIGVFANASGGFRSTLIVPFIFGVLEILLVSVMLNLVNNSASGDFTITKEVENVVEEAKSEWVEGVKTISGEVKTITKVNQELVPWQTGYNGMFDWTAVFSIPTMIASGQRIVGWIVYPLCILGMLFGAQIIDSGKQKKKTFLQKRFNLNPKLISASQQK